VLATDRHRRWVVAQAGRPTPEQASRIARIWFHPRQADRVPDAGRGRP
jgi:hypothetical protein